MKKISCLLLIISLGHSSQSLKYCIDPDPKESDLKLKNKIEEKFINGLKYGPYYNLIYADAINFLIESYPNYLKRTSVHTNSISSIHRIFNKYKVERGTFINNPDAATPWISFELPISTLNNSQYGRIKDVLSFVVTKDVYDLLKQNNIFEDLKTIRL